MSCPSLPSINTNYRNIVESASTSSGCQTWSLSDEGINPLDSLHGDHIIGHLADAELNQEIHLQNQEELKIAEQRIKYLKEKLEGESDSISELKESVSKLNSLAEEKHALHDEVASHSIPRKILPDKDMMNFLHKLHASKVPDHRKNLLEEISHSFNMSCQQLGLVLSQLRYLAEKDFAVHLFCSEIIDPENLSELINSLEDDPYQDKHVIASIVNSIAATL